jgi:hypothetical protein
VAVNRHHTGSGRRRVIPEDWGRNHAPVAAGTRNAVVTLRRPATTEWDPDAADGRGATVTTPGAVYASQVSARIQAQINRSHNDTTTAEETVTVPPYLVTVDHDLQPHDGDEVQVVTCAGDPTLVGQPLRIDHVLRGTERFERDLFCTLTYVPTSDE